MEGNNWEDLTEEEKEAFIKLVNDKYPEVFLILMDTVALLMNALQPLIEPVFEVCNMIATHIWEIMKKTFTPEQLEDLMSQYESNTNGKTTDIGK